MQIGLTESGEHSGGTREYNFNVFQLQEKILGHMTEEGLITTVSNHL